MRCDNCHPTWPKVVTDNTIVNRFKIIMQSTPMPELNLKEVDILFWGLAIDGEAGIGCPRDILIQWCFFRKHAEEYDWQNDLWYSTVHPKGAAVPCPIDFSVHDNLIERIKNWTEVERIKVIKTFEDFRNINFSALAITPEVIFIILEHIKITL